LSRRPELALAQLANSEDDPQRAQDGQQKAGAGLSIEGVVGDQARDERPGNAHQHRFEDAHRVTPGERKPGERTHHESGERQAQNVGDDLHQA